MTNTPNILARVPEDKLPEPSAPLAHTVLSPLLVYGGLPHLEQTPTISDPS
jgi:hypothetical protein